MGIFALFLVLLGCHTVFNHKLTFLLHLRIMFGLARWFMPVIPVLWEAEVGGSQGQEFETSLAIMVKPRLY